MAVKVRAKVRADGKIVAEEPGAVADLTDMRGLTQLAEIALVKAREATRDAPPRDLSVEFEWLS